MILSSKINTDDKSDWQTELSATAFRYHSIVAWVAVFFNPVFAISDYYNSPAHFTSFFIFRICVSIAIIISLLLKDKFRKFPELIAYVAFLGISIQNAYMYSVMETAELQKHTFAYLALFIGAGMFVIWKPVHSLVVVVVTFAANFIFFSINSPLHINEILINGGLLTASVALFTIVLINTRTNLTKREIIARLALAESNRELGIKNKIIEEKNKDIKDSIVYAQRIQQAIFPPKEKVESILRDYFILFRPKDIVSGDFFWIEQLSTTPRDNTPPEDIIVVAAVDCTGHGVPGALMSIIGSTILNQSTGDYNVNTPAEALNYLNTQLASNLNSIQDGMDMSLCAINMSTLQMQYAGANNSVYIVRSKELIELKPDKMAIGGDHENYDKKTFTNNTIALEKNDIIYLFTDGYADQFGGELGKKFKYKNFQKLLLEFHDNAMEDQQHILNYHFKQWKGDIEQTDDVLVIGIRI
jgi:serine phosphatase RsbU (regulator of sigma subunit)